MTGSEGTLVREERDLDREGVRAIAVELAQMLVAGLAREGRSGVLLGLEGELGAGKTTFVQALVGALPGGAADHVTSPTYALLQVYETRPRVRHWDLYRLASREELDAIGWSDLIDAPGLDVVEWIRQVPDAPPAEWIEVQLVPRGEDRRDLRVLAHGDRNARLLRKVPQE